MKTSTTIQFVAFALASMLVNTSCSVVPKSAPALEVLEGWHASSSLVSSSAPKNAFNKTAMIVNSRVSTLQQSVIDETPWMFTKADFSAERVADIKPEVDSYLESAPKIEVSSDGGIISSQLAVWLLKWADKNRKESAEAAKMRLEGYRWKLR